jgi:hypothetical protein
MFGEVAERLIAPELDSGDCNRSVGSNPTLSAYSESRGYGVGGKNPNH